LTFGSISVLPAIVHRFLPLPRQEVVNLRLVAEFWIEYFAPLLLG